MPATKLKSATIEDCDRKVASVWARLRDDPEADPVQCRDEINLWLDARLQLMGIKPKKK